jgi:GntR family transcriptional regulator / MocR family aminotransferase
MIGRGAAPLMLALDLGGAPLFRQIYDGVRDAILEGRLRPGTRLPATRMLAQDLGVSRSTVVLAFEHLIAEGYVSGHRGTGSFVARNLPEERLPRMVPGWPLAEKRGIASDGPRPVSRFAELVRRQALGAPLVRRAPVPFRIGEPALDAFPRKVWEQLHARRWRRGSGTLLTYGSPVGYRPLREAIASYLGASRGVRASADQVILTRGSQQAIDLAARLLLDPGDAVWLEDPGYLAARALFQCAGARVMPVQVDDEGLDVSRGIARAPGARLAYVAPSHQFPLGVTMSLPRRLALLDWARSGRWILEDDYDGEFRYGGRALASLQGLDDANRVLYMGTFSKTMFPSLRLGYIVVPPDLVELFTEARTVLDHLAPSITQAVLADFIAEGHFARHLRRMRALYLERQEALAAIAARELAGLLHATPVETGMHLVGWLEDTSLDDAVISQLAFNAGIEVPPLSRYCIEPQLPPALLMGFAATSERAISGALRTLRDVLSAARSR